MFESLQNVITNFFIGTGNGMGNGNDQMALEFQQIKPIGSRGIW